jgi:hypothetical protein
VEGAARCPNPTQRESRADSDLLASTLLGGSNHAFIYIKFYHRVNQRGNYAYGFYNSMTNDKDGHMPSPLILFTCTALHYAPLEWQKTKGVHLKASKTKLNADRPDRSNYFNHKNDSGKITSRCAVTDCKLLTLPGVADRYTLLMNT